MTLRSVSLQALGASGALVAWTLTELDLAESSGAGGRLVALLALWAISYLTGFRAGQSLAKDPAKWRLPFIASSLLVWAAAYLAGGGGWELLAYVLASAGLGLYTAASTAVVFNVHSGDSWMFALARLRLLSGLAYTGWAGLALAARSHGLPLVSHVSLWAAGLLVLLAGYSFRRPAVPETALAQLDRSVDALAFGSPAPYVSMRGLASIALLFSLGVMARVLTLKAYRGVVGPFEVLALYAVSYTFGALLGTRIKSPGQVALAGVAVAVLHALVPPGPVGGPVEISASVAFSALAETGLVLYVLYTAPLMLGRATLLATVAVALGSMASAGLIWAGVSYELVLLAMALGSLAVQYRGPGWE